MEISLKRGSKTPAEPIPSYFYSPHTVWTINLADRGGEQTGRGYGCVGSGLIMPLTVPLTNGIIMDRVELRPGAEQSYGSS